MSDDQEVRKIRAAIAGMPTTIESGLSSPENERHRQIEMGRACRKGFSWARRRKQR